MFKTHHILLAVSAVILGQQPDSTLIDAARRDDVYAIYSLLMTNPPAGLRTSSSVYLIAANTWSGSALLSGNPPQPCAIPPAEYSDKWTEVLADFQSRKSNAEVLEPLLQLAKPYVLLTDGETREFEVDVNSVNKGALNPKFQDARELYRLGRVYFDRNRTLALTAVSTYCGSLCGRSGWRLFEKGSNGQWQLLTRRAGPTTCGDSIA